MQPKVEQGPGAANVAQFCLKLERLHPQFFCHTDDRIGDVDGIFEHIFFNAAEVAQIVGVDKCAQCVGVHAEIAEDRIPFDLGGSAVVDDVKIFAQPHQTGTFAHDVVCQPMQRAHPVANAGQQTPSLTQKGANAAAKVGNCAVGKGDHQHFAVIHLSFTRQPLDQARRQ